AERAGDPGPARSRAEQCRDRAAPVHLRGDGEVPRRQPHGQARCATPRRGGVRGQQARPNLTSPNLTSPNLTSPDLTGSWPGRAQVSAEPGPLLVSSAPAWPPGRWTYSPTGWLLARNRYRAPVTAGW